MMIPHSNNADDTQKGSDVPNSLQEFVAPSDTTMPRQACPTSTPNMSKSFANAIERIVGEDIETIRRTPIDERRRKVEASRGAPLRFVTRFPFIGRGNVLRDRTIDHQKVEQLLDEALS
jgi:hypothetical protein